MSEQGAGPGAARWRRRWRWTASAGAALLVAGVMVTVLSSGDGGTGRPVSPPRVKWPDCPTSSASAPARSARRAAPMQGVEFAKAKSVLQRHRDQIRRRYPGTKGTGIDSVVSPGDLSRAGQKVYGIIVFLDKTSRRPPAGQSIEGVPLKFEVSGRYRALPGPVCSPR